ncbi:MAG: hypothetical protein PVI88_04285 [Nitrosopumilaceae archaeon]|jgi:phage FluMu protein Com
MNIYDTRQIRCVTCDKTIGEVEMDAEITTQCEACANHLPQGEDQLMHTRSFYLSE